MYGRSNTSPGGGGGVLLRLSPIRIHHCLSLTQTPPGGRGTKRPPPLQPPCNDPLLSSGPSIPLEAKAIGWTCGPGGPPKDRPPHFTGGCRALPPPPPLWASTPSDARRGGCALQQTPLVGLCLRRALGRGGATGGGGGFLSTAPLPRPPGAVWSRDRTTRSPPYGDVWCAGHREQAHVSTMKASSVVPQAQGGP